MSEYPKPRIEPETKDLKLGIKSSLPNATSAIALVYLLWKVSSKKDSFQFTKEKGKVIELSDTISNELVKFVSKFISVEQKVKFERIINTNPILTAQIEPLIVAFELIWKLCKFSFVDDYPFSKERTGEQRFNKIISYTINIDLLDMLVDTNESEFINVLISWILGDIKKTNEYSKKLIKLITLISEEAVYKIQNNDNEIIFNNLGIYQTLLTGNTVNLTGEKENKGSLRILCSSLKEGLNKYIDYRDQEFIISVSESEENLKYYKARVKNTLELSNMKIHYDDFFHQENNFEIRQDFYSLSLEKLGAELQKMYDNAPEKGKVTSIHLFGIKYAKVILSNNYSPASIIKCTTLNESYTTEISKGINIYKELSTGLYNSVFSNDSENKLEDQSSLIFQSSTATTFTLPPALDSPTTFRYVRSLLAKPFAILTGNSGTGKTRIALNLAKYLEKTSTDGNYKNSLLIPVGADWTDNTKLLGFYNPMTHRYQSTATLDFILNAQKNPTIPFFLILDEMNLSHVERYFSDFLSAMESGENIPLYKKDVDCKEEVIPESIELPKNLFVTGTVNIDETTYMFSPKVLDRANVIEFKPEMNDVLNLLLDDVKNAEVETAESGVAEAFLKVSETVRSSQLANYSSISFDKAKGTLESLYTELKEVGFEFAFRTVKEIRHYVIAAYELADEKKLFEIEKVLDEQIVQKILPKIHGNRKQIGSLLEKLKSVCPIEPYKLSNDKITQMKSRLEKYQYASFI